MAYKESEARKLIIKAGLLLVEEKLVARTWGNISARIGNNEFIITPSGRAYETLTEDDLVKVKMDDLSYEGDIKPSSEKGIHAAIYIIRKDIDFVIHTHQDYATAVSLDKNGIKFAPCARYALPGTKKLRKHVCEVLENTNSKAILLERHGAFCFGKTVDEAFEVAKKLEVQSKEYYDKHIREVSKEKLSKPYLDDYAQMYGFGSDCVEKEDIEAANIIKAKNEIAARFDCSLRPMNFIDVLLQHTVYKKKYSKMKDK